MFHTKLEEAKKLVEHSIDMRLTRPRKTPWSFHSLSPRNKDKTLRFRLDYRELNRFTIEDIYLIPRIDSFIDQACTAKFLALSTGELAIIN